MLSGLLSFSMIMMFAMVILVKHETEMKTYYITHISSTDHDCFSVWAGAESKEKARSDVQDEY